MTISDLSEFVTQVFSYALSSTGYVKVVASGCEPEIGWKQYKDRWLLLLVECNEKGVWTDSIAYRIYEPADVSHLIREFVGHDS